MTIAFDATSVPPRPAGNGVYAIELIHAMAERESSDEYAVFTRGPWFDDIAARQQNWHIEQVQTKSRPARLAWEQLQLPRGLRRLHADVLHSTHHTLPIRSGGSRRVVTIHDVTFFRIPQRYPLARRLYMQTLTRIAARVADAIIVPSAAVRDDVLRVLGVPQERIHVVYEAARGQFQPIDKSVALRVAQKYGLKMPYVLSVGSLEPGKNRARLIRAADELRRQGCFFDLAIVGQKAWKYEGDLALVRELRADSWVQFLGYVPDDDLASLYSAATAFAYPSLYEGFGLGVLEAMAAGVPVLTSNVSATAEIAGDAAVLVDPHHTAQIRDGLARLLTDAAIRGDLVQRGFRRASEFSWRRAADETHAIYEHVARQ